MRRFELCSQRETIPAVHWTLNKFPNVEQVLLFQIMAKTDLQWIGVNQESLSQAMFNQMFFWFLCFSKTNVSGSLKKWMHTWTERSWNLQRFFLTRCRPSTCILTLPLIVPTLNGLAAEGMCEWLHIDQCVRQIYQRKASDLVRRGMNVANVCQTILRIEESHAFSQLTAMHQMLSSAVPIRLFNSHEHQLSQSQFGCSIWPFHEKIPCVLLLDLTKLTMSLAFVVSQLCFTTSLHQHFSLGWKLHCPRWVWLADTTKHNTTQHDKSFICNPPHVACLLQCSLCGAADRMWSPQRWWLKSASQSACCNLLLHWLLAMQHFGAVTWMNNWQIQSPMGLETMKETQMHLPRSREKEGKGRSESWARKLASSNNNMTSSNINKPHSHPRADSTWNLWHLSHWKKLRSCARLGSRGDRSFSGVLSNIRIDVFEETSKHSTLILLTGLDQRVRGLLSLPLVPLWSIHVAHHCHCCPNWWFSCSNNIRRASAKLAIVNNNLPKWQLQLDLPVNNCPKRKKEIPSVWNSWDWANAVVPNRAQLKHLVCAPQHTSSPVSSVTSSYPPHVDCHLDKLCWWQVLILIMEIVSWVNCLKWIQMNCLTWIQRVPPPSPSSSSFS